MEKQTFLKVYTGAFVIYLSYRLVFYLVLTTLQGAEEIIENENKKTDNDKVISKDCRGGQNPMILKKNGNLAQRLLARWIKNRKIYKKSVAIAKSAGAVVAFTVMRLWERYDWWSVVIAKSLVSIPEKDVAILSGLRRMRLGLTVYYVCKPFVDEVFQNVIKEEYYEATKYWMHLLTGFDELKDSDQQKNPYFACIIGLLTLLLKLNPAYARFLIENLYELYKAGKISYLTYLEIIWHLISTGKLPREKYLPIKSALFGIFDLIT